MKQYRAKKGLNGEDGVASVEFAILVIVLLLILLGTIQFGLMWYAKYAISAAAREGARYATVYKTVTHNNHIDPVLPSELDPSVQSVVQNYANGLLNKHVDVDPSGPGWTVTDPNLVSGLDVTIKVSLKNPYNLMGDLLPGLSDMTFQAQVTMRHE